MINRRSGLAVALIGLVGVGIAAFPCFAQYDPGNGIWGKESGGDIRVMTWNVQDGLCSSNDKTDGLNNWNAITRIVASLRPDVLLLQETADNSGNGTGSGADSVANLLLTLNLWLHGGNDPFKVGTPPVTSYVQLYSPGYDLPYIFVSTDSDGFNRNVILSRFPFSDINGDNRDQYSDIPFIISDLYSPGGDGGIRGFAFAEIDLYDGIYAGDLVVGNAHLKSGGDSSSRAQRITASQNVAYFIDHLLNGAGTGSPDPRGRIIDTPAVTSILPTNTPVVLGGDWNEDEQTNGRKGPADWLIRAEFAGGTDGTDRDQTDMVFDTSINIFNGSRATQSSSKLDYVAWQDSIATARNQFVFNSSSIPASAMPLELVGYPVNANLASGFAADHRPVIVDLIVPLVSDPPLLSWAGDNQVGGTVTFTVQGPPNSKVGFIVGPQGIFPRVGFDFCSIPPFDVKRRPAILSTNGAGIATVDWMVNTATDITRNSHAAVKINGVFEQTNCVNVPIR